MPINPRRISLATKSCNPIYRNDQDHYVSTIHIDILHGDDRENIGAATVYDIHSCLTGLVLNMIRNILIEYPATLAGIGACGGTEIATPPDVLKKRQQNTRRSRYQKSAGIGKIEINSRWAS
jgi:hypothetical protein